MTGAEPEQKKSIVTKKFNARYAYDGKHYQLASGDNPTDGSGPHITPSGTNGGTN